MTAIAIADPFAAAHEDLVEQLEPFCDEYLDRFSDQELLDAYDLATAWTQDLPTARLAANAIAAEWYARYRRNLPRGGSELPWAGLAAQFDRELADLDALL